jgi:protein O-mannosyl-transferase
MKQVNKKQKPSSGVNTLHKTGNAAKQQKSASMAAEPSYARWVVVSVILLVTFMAFFPSLQNNLLKTWDDQAYVTKNELVKSLSGSNIIKIFREDKGLYANYHPLTTLSLAINYYFSKEEPFGYHLTNLLLHLLNTLLVFIFIYLLTKNSLEIAAITALLFGLTPVHVESVAWISERKDVLYAFFFLASLIAYQLFLKKSDWKLYAVSLCLFLCAMLSKAMAASLPLVLILIGFMEKKRWTWKLLPDKIPYFALAILLGIHAIRIQAEGNAIGAVMFPFGMRVLHACYGFAAYMLKIILPAGLSAFYPYPYPLLNAGWITNTTPAVFYLTLILTVVIFCFSMYCLVSHKKNLNITGFGLMFYAATIALVLQFLPVGRAIMADRYAYVPAIGLFFIIGYYASLLYHKKAYKVPVIVIVAIYAGFLFFLTREQTRVWKNDETLWNNVIRRYPSDNRIVIAYANRAQFFQLEGKPLEALKDLLVVADWNPKDENALDMVGKIYGKELHDMETSIKYFQQALQANPRNLEVIKDLATVYGMKGDFKQSLEYSFRGLEISKNDPFLLYSAGVNYSNLGQLDLGKSYIKKAIEIDPTLNHK